MENKMKNKVFHIFLFVLIVTALLCGCMGQAKTPGIHFESASYDFGLIDEGKPVNHVFEFTNTGTDTLIIKEVHPTCGCTVAGDYDKEVKPRQTGKLPVTFKTAGNDGPVSKTIIVKTNVRGNPDVTLALNGTVRVAINLNPKVLSFGNIERNRTAPLEGEISISNRLPDPIRITDIIKVDDDLTVPNVTLSNDNVETNIKTIKAGFQFTIGIRVRPPFKHGQVMGTLLIKTDSSILPEIHTQFSYYLEPLVKVYPNPLFVTKDQVANGGDQLVNVVCEPGFDMSIADLSVNIDKVKLSLKEVEKGKSYTVVLSFPKGFSLDPANTLTVKFKAKNVPDEPVFGVPVLEMK
jgi:hypothetical protein